MEGSRDKSDLAQVLALFESLPASAQATALQKIQAGQPKANANNEAVGVHICALCKNFGLLCDSPERDRALAEARSRLPDFDESGAGVAFQRQYPYLSIPRSLTKDALMQGLSRRCVLFQWISTLLDRTLAPFKAEVAKKGIFIQRGSRNVSGIVLHDSLEDPEYNFGHIDPARGLEVRISVDQTDIAESTLTVGYNPNPSLLDSLWSVSPKPEGKADYPAFERLHRVPGSMHLTGYATSDDPIAKIISSRPTKSTFNVRESLSFARSWLDTCNSQHSRCARAAGVLPSRVIDVGTRFPIRVVKLHWTEEYETGHYVALSYCWGGHQSLVTTRTTAQEFTDGIPISRIPKTIIDAIHVTYELGLRYLWVDALCIIQDEPEDVAREIGRMAQIYQQACLTVSAACACSVKDGFLSRKRRPVVASVKLPVTLPDGGEGFIYLQQPHVYSSVEDPIHLRAWTLQEHILPHRMLVFGTQGPWWTCPSNPSPSMSSPSSTFPTPTPITRPTLTSWRSLISDYTRRFLAFPTDKLPAIAGIAAHYSKPLDSAYLAGLWGSALVPELMWCSTRADITRPVVQHAPSWSWAAVDGEVHHRWCLVGPGPRSPRVLRCVAPPVLRASPFGAVEAGKCVLSLEAEMALLYWHDDRRRIFSRRPERGEVSEQLEIGRSQADALEEGRRDGGMEVWALLVQEEPCRGLLLVEAGEGRYRRVGLFYRIWALEACRFERMVVDIV